MSEVSPWIATQSSICCVIFWKSLLYICLSMNRSFSFILVFALWSFWYPQSRGIKLWILGGRMPTEMSLSSQNIDNILTNLVEVCASAPFCQKYACHSSGWAMQLFNKCRMHPSDDNSLQKNFANNSFLRHYTRFWFSKSAEQLLYFKFDNFEK